MVQGVERNRGRLEARALMRFEVNAEEVCFPAAAQGARLMRFVDRRDAKSEEVEIEWLVSSRPTERLSAAAMLAADRDYWGIENGLHLRLDGAAREDASRVRHPVNSWNLGMIRRATMSLALTWIAHCRDKRQATLQGFYDAMAVGNARKAFSLVTVSKPSWLPK